MFFIQSRDKEVSLTFFLFGGQVVCGTNGHHLLNPGDSYIHCVSRGGVHKYSTTLFCGVK